MNHNNTPSRGVLQPVPALPAPPPSADDGGERRRIALRRLLARKNITPTDLARLIGMPNANALYNHFAGRSAALSLETIERIATLFPDVPFTELVGLAQHKLTDSAKRGNERPGVLVTLEVAAGVWRPRQELPSEQWTPLPLPKEFAGNSETLFAARVKEPGAEHLYPANTVLLCRYLAMATEPIASGTRCIVRQSRRARVELTVRELCHTNGETWLWTRSTDPHHQVPLQLSTTDGGTITETEGRAAVDILGIVVASWQPEPASRHT